MSRLLSRRISNALHDGLDLSPWRIDNLMDKLPVSYPVVLDTSVGIGINRRNMGDIRDKMARITRKHRETHESSRNFSRSSLIGIDDDDENAAKLSNQTREVIQRIVKQACTS